MLVGKLQKHTHKNNKIAPPLKQESKSVTAVQPMETYIRYLVTYKYMIDYKYMTVHPLCFPW